jgi:hypothetical protein
MSSFISIWLSGEEVPDRAPREQSPCAPAVSARVSEKIPDTPRPDLSVFAAFGYMCE